MNNSVPIIDPCGAPRSSKVEVITSWSLLTDIPARGNEANHKIHHLDLNFQAWSELLPGSLGKSRALRRSNFSKFIVRNILHPVSQIAICLPIYLFNVPINV